MEEKSFHEEDLEDKTLKGLLDESDEPEAQEEEKKFDSTRIYPVNYKEAIEYDGRRHNSWKTRGVFVLGRVRDWVISAFIAGKLREFETIEESLAAVVPSDYDEVYEYDVKFIGSKYAGFYGYYASGIAVKYNKKED